VIRRICDSESKNKKQITHGDTSQCHHRINQSALTQQIQWVLTLKRASTSLEPFANAPSWSKRMRTTRSSWPAVVAQIRALIDAKARKTQA